MMTEAFLSLLDHVKPTARGWRARCPAHQGKSLSLSIREAEDGRILVHCFAGCSMRAICEALHISVRELFGPEQQDAAEIQRARIQRDMRQREHDQIQRARGAAADAERKAARLLSSAKNVSIDHWSTPFLDLTLNRLADAYAVIGASYEQE
ncbi:MAG: hypothetical protein LZF60_360079 [Nitrospira sp.]|nr:MAG: hypothetical protein LZF60_360079 [Nitrospira sp.]